MSFLDGANNPRGREAAELERRKAEYENRMNALKNERIAIYAPLHAAARKLDPIVTQNLRLLAIKQWGHRSIFSLLGISRKNPWKLHSPTCEDSQPCWSIIYSYLPHAWEVWTVSLQTGTDGRLIFDAHGFSTSDTSEKELQSLLTQRYGIGPVKDGYNPE
jgi:hypothetical protein